MNKIKDILIFIILLLLAVWLSPFVLIGAFVYCAYKIHKIFLRKKLLTEIEKKWFPEHKHTLFIYSNSEKWKDYFEKNILPKIQRNASIINWSTRQKDKWANDSIEMRALKLYKPSGYFYPMAIVFLPSGKIKIFQFHDPYVAMLKLGNDKYKDLEKEFLTLISSIEKPTKKRLAKIC